MKIRDDINAVGRTPGQQVVEILEASVNLIAVGRIIVRPVGHVEEFLEIKRDAHTVKTLLVQIGNVSRGNEIAPVSIQHLGGQVGVAAEYVQYRGDEGIVVIGDPAAPGAGVCIIGQAEVAHHVKLRPEPGAEVYAAQNDRLVAGVEVGYSEGMDITCL